MPKKNKIIYLLGSGATHAVINSLDPTKQFLTADIRQKIREDESKTKEISDNIWNELMDPSVDIEHLISILDINYNYHSVQQIRKYYHDAIIKLSKEFIGNIKKVKHTPNLYSLLFDFHLIKDINEEVLSVFTLNYEDLLEQSLQFHLNLETDYIINPRKIVTKGAIPVLKLHGSFNWKNSRSIIIGNANSINSSEALWIPPGVDKKKENYPFNILWGRAFELLLECDTLRIIGCSLSRNDWGLIPMIYSALRLSENKSPFQIEVIDFIDVGEKVKANYPYLNIRAITEIPEFNEYIFDFYSLTPTSSLPSYVLDNISSNASKKINVFEWWLKSKGRWRQNRSLSIATPKKYFQNFIK